MNDTSRRKHRHRAGRFGLGRLARSLERARSGIFRGALGRLALAFAFLVLASGALIVLIESEGDGMFERLFDGVWWAMVTIGTVGYGDKYPQSDAGKAFAMVLIAASVVISSLISGTIAAIYVDRRIKEGKGLRDLHLRGHLVLLGWNRNARSVLSGFAASPQERSGPLALVSMLEPEAFDALRAAFPALDLRFVRGDFTQEGVLRKASIQAARAVVILPDETGGQNLANADERVILAALAVKSLNPEALVSAEIQRPESEQHLKRARVEDVVVSGEFSGYLLSAASSESGVPHAVRALLSWDGPRLRQAPFPPALLGKTYAEASSWFLRNGEGSLVGVLSRERRVSLDDLLADDSSAIDAFIKRKFHEADIDLEEEGAGERSVRLDPGADYAIREGDLAFLVGAGAGR